MIFVASCSNGDAKLDGGGDDGPIVDGPKDRQASDTYVPGCDITMTCDDVNPPPMSQCIVKFDTSLVDMNGGPITTEKLFLCGTNICTPPLAPDLQGKISTWVCTTFVRGAAKFLGETRYASFTSLAPTQAMVTIPPLPLIPLPATGVDIPMGSGTVTSNMASLTVSGTVTFDPSEPMDVDLHRFRAVQIPIAKAPPGMPSNIQVLWGLAPVNAALKPAAKLTVPNTLSWPANATVLVFLNGVDGFEMAPPVPYGSWTQIGIGHVDAQGMTISTDTGVGNGVPMLGMVGLQKM